jgi:hypothetical protein
MILEQRGSTCGIYACINGLLQQTTVEEEHIHAEVAKLVSQNSFLTLDSDATTLLGEFFDIALFQQFLKNNERELCTLLRINDLQVRTVPFGEFNDATFYIVPGIRPRKWYESKKNAILHWVTVMPDFRVFNSAYATEEVMTRGALRHFHEALDGLSFSWKRWRRKNNIGIHDELIDVPSSRQLAKLALQQPNFQMDIPFQTGHMLAVWAH